MWPIFCSIPLFEFPFSYWQHFHKEWNSTHWGVTNQIVLRPRNANIMLSKLSLKIKLIIPIIRKNMGTSVFPIKHQEEKNFLCCCLWWKQCLISQISLIKSLSISFCKITIADSFWYFEHMFIFLKKTMIACCLFAWTTVCATELIVDISSSNMCGRRRILKDGAITISSKSLDPMDIIHLMELLIQSSFPH